MIFWNVCTSCRSHKISTNTAQGLFSHYNMPRYSHVRPCQRTGNYWVLNGRSFCPCTNHLFQSFRFFRFLFSKLLFCFLIFSSFWASSFSALVPGLVIGGVLKFVNFLGSSCRCSPGIPTSHTALSLSLSRSPPRFLYICFDYSSSLCIFSP